MLSYAEIGSAAMLSRAVAGVWSGRAVFSVPGSTRRGAPRVGEAHRAGGRPRRARDPQGRGPPLLTRARRRPAKGREVLTAWKARAEKAR